VSELFIEHTGKTTKDGSYGSYSARNTDEKSGTGVPFLDVTRWLWLITTQREPIS